MPQRTSWILVVDDDRAIAQLICEVLGDEGYTMRVCSSATAAWELLQDHTPALVITDLRMETEQAGFTLVQRMRAAPTLVSIPAILCAANYRFLITHLDELHQLNCEMLEKPFDLVDLVTKVESVIALHASTA
jgi:DNA-binding NtrC family response regulator